MAISIFSPSEGKRFAAIRKATNNALELRSLPDAKAIIAAKKKRFRDDLEKQMSKSNPVYWQMAEELSELYDPLAVMATLLDMKFHKELLPENYPALSKGKQERKFGSMRGTHRDHTPDNERRPRRRSEKNPAAAEDVPSENTGRKDRDFRKKKRFSENEKSSPDASENTRNRERKPHRNENAGEKPRKKLRDWAMDLTGNAQDLSRYKNKKRK